MSNSAMKEYFDSIADKWDGWMDMERINARIEDGLKRFEVGGGENVLDVGCGTGNLTRKILERLNDAGRVTAVDVSDHMVELAREKNRDSRASFLVADVTDLPLEDAGLDRVICFSMWPHVSEPEAALNELNRVLKPGGKLHVWHIDSKETINHVHANAGEAVHNDVLVPAEELAEVVRGAGFDVRTVIDNDEEYVVSAVKDGGNHR